LGRGFRLTVVEDGEVALADAVEDDRVPGLNAVGSEDDHQVVAKVGGDGIIEAMTNKCPQPPLHDDFAADRKNARQLSTGDGSEVNEIERIAGEPGSIAV
jgi:hypothetical protein